jgi:hypothetical protein
MVFEEKLFMVSTWPLDGIQITTNGIEIPWELLACFTDWWKFPFPIDVLSYIKKPIAMLVYCRFF